MKKGTLAKKVDRRTVKYLPEKIGKISKEDINNILGRIKKIIATYGPAAVAIANIIIDTLEKKPESKPKRKTAKK